MPISEILLTVVFFSLIFIGLITYKKTANQRDHLSDENDKLQSKINKLQNEKEEITRKHNEIIRKHETYKQTFDIKRAYYLRKNYFKYYQSLIETIINDNFLKELPFNNNTIQILYLFFLKGYSLKQISQVTGNSTNTIKNKLEKSPIYLKDHIEFIEYLKNKYLQLSIEYEKKLPLGYKLYSRWDNFLDLPIRADKRLKEKNIIYLNELISQTENDLLELPGFGEKTLSYVKEELKRHDLYLKSTT